MKKTIISIAFPIIGLCVGFGLVYLAAAFGNASFDITQWNDGTRGLIAFFGFVASVVAASAGGMIAQEINSK